MLAGLRFSVFLQQIHYQHVRYFLIKQWGWQWTIDHFVWLFMKVGPLGDRTGALTVTSISGAAMWIWWEWDSSQWQIQTQLHHIITSCQVELVPTLAPFVEWLEVFSFPTSFCAQNAEKLRWQDVKGSHEEQLEQLWLARVWSFVTWYLWCRIKCVPLNWKKHHGLKCLSLPKQNFGEEWRCMSYPKGHHFRTFPEWPGIECAWVHCEIPRSMRKVGLLLILTGTTPDLTADLELSPLDRDPEKGVVDGCVAGCFKLWSIQAFSSNIIPWFVRHDDASFGSQGRSDSISHHSPSRKKQLSCLEWDYAVTIFFEKSSPEGDTWRVCHQQL